MGRLPRPAPELARLAARADVDRDQRRARPLDDPVDLPAHPRAGPALRRPAPDGPLHALHITLGLAVGARRLLHRPGLLGRAIQALPADDDHPLRDPRRRSGSWPRRLALNHSAGLAEIARVVPALVVVRRAVRAGGSDARRRSACWPTCPRPTPPTAARSWASTSVFLALGQITGSLIGGVAASSRGIDGLLVATLVLLGVALAPLARLRAVEHARASRRRSRTGPPSRPRAGLARQLSSRTGRASVRGPCPSRYHRGPTAVFAPRLAPHAQEDAAMSRVAIVTDSASRPAAADAAAAGITVVPLDGHLRATRPSRPASTSRPRSSGGG